MSDKRQNNQLVLAFTETSRSEAPRDSAEGTEALMEKREAESKAASELLMEEVCERRNCEQALARVKSNKGSAGIAITTHSRRLRVKLRAIRSPWATSRSTLANRNPKSPIVASISCHGRIQTSSHS